MENAIENPNPIKNPHIIEPVNDGTPIVEQVKDAPTPAAEVTGSQEKEETEAAEVQPKKRSVYTVAAKFYPVEYDFIAEVLKARQAITNKEGKPFTRDMNHFIRQCVQFTLNHKDGMKFGIPPTVSKRVNIDI